MGHLRLRDAHLRLRVPRGPLRFLRANNAAKREARAIGPARQFAAEHPGTTIDDTLTYGGYKLTVTGDGGEADLSPYMSLSVQISTVPSALKKLTVSITETNIPAGPGTVVDMTSANAAIFYTSGNSVTTSSYYDLSDALFGEADPFHSSTLNSTSTSTSYEDIFRVSSPFSITKVLAIKPASTGSHPLVQATINVQLPEPSSLLLIAPALAGLAFLRRRRSARA